MTNAPSNLIQDILSSAQFLSRLPIHKFYNLNETPKFKTSSYTYGVAGILISLPAALIAVLCVWLGLSVWVSAILTVAAGIVTTGALHEDGLADMADGFWGGHTITRKLAIMRDSAIGTYGVLALILSFALRTALLATVFSATDYAACAAVLAIGGLSRFSMLWPWSTLPQARKADELTSEDNQEITAKEAESLAAKFGAPDQSVFTKSIAFAVPALVLLGFALPPIAMVTSLVFGAAAVVCITGLSRHHIKGHTGDTLGATQQFCEIGLYLGACIAI